MEIGIGASLYDLVEDLVNKAFDRSRKRGDKYAQELADAKAKIYKHYEDLWYALEESVKLQSHYASLLNMHDGGERIGFKDAQEWYDRVWEVRNAKLITTRETK